jgi:beta-glucosidase
VDKVDQALQVRVKVTNTGQRDGEEIIQVYIGMTDSQVERQVKLLKGFEKVAIPAGAAADVTIAIPLGELCYYDPQAKGWRLEPGIYQVLAGPSSDERTLLKTTIELTPEA